MYIENCTCPVATHVSRQMDNVTWHVNCASETDSDKCDPETGVYLDCQHSHTGISHEDNRDEKFIWRKGNAQISSRLGRKKSLNLIMCRRKKNFERLNGRLKRLDSNALVQLMHDLFLWIHVLILIYNDQILHS